MEYFKKHGWIAVMAVIFDFIAFKYWKSYLTDGSIYDGKHGISFFGEASYGHLAGATLGAVILSYYFIKSLVQFNRAH